MERKPLADIIPYNIPEFLQSSDNLINYLRSAGVYLDGTKDRILQFDFSRDYQFGTAYNIEQSLLSLGFTIPPLLSDALRRLILRDAVETFIRKGTEDSLIWVLKIIGLEPEVRYAWLPSAVEVKKGYIIDPVTKARVRYAPDQFSYNKFLYGTEVIDNDGHVYFEGYTYNDIFLENKIGPLPILGEYYKTTQSNQSEAVSKTPYIVVRVGEQQYNTVTDPYIGSDGQQYEYTNIEAFRVVNDLIEYFLYQVNKPTHTRVIIVSLQIFDPEGMSISDELEQTPTHAPTPETETTDIIEQADLDGTITMTPMLIGEYGLVVGEEVPYESQLSVSDGGVIIGQDPQTHPEKLIENWSEFSTETWIDAPDAGLSRPIPIRALTNVSFQAPTDTSVTVRGIYHKSDLGNFLSLGTVAANATFDFTNDHRFHMIQLSFTSASSKKIKVSLVNTGNY